MNRRERPCRTRAIPRNSKPAFTRVVCKRLYPVGRLKSAPVTGIKVLPSEAGGASVATTVEEGIRTSPALTMVVAVKVAVAVIVAEGVIVQVGVIEGSGVSVGRGVLVTSEQYWGPVDRSMVFWSLPEV